MIGMLRTECNGRETIRANDASPLIRKSVMLGEKYGKWELYPPHGEG